MKKLILKTISAVLAILTMAFSCAVVFSAKNCYDGITSAKTPISNASLKYAVKLGNGYAHSPMPPVVCDDMLIVVSGNQLYKLNASNGKIVKKVQLESKNTYTTVSPLVANGMIFVQLDGGIIQAFDYATMASLWIYKDALGGQSLCNINYSGGYIYTGFWNGNTRDANYVCIAVKDDNPKKGDEVKKAKWAYKNKGGYYFADGTIVSNYIIFGCDNGKEDDTSASKILCLDKTSGKKKSSLTVSGDIRSGVVYDSSLKRCFCSSKAGFLYSFSVNSSGILSALKSVTLSGAATATPVVYGGRVYLGASNGSSGGRFYVIDAVNMKTIYFSTLDGYPQSTALLSTAYESSGKIYIYITLNYKPGDIYLFEDSAGQTTAKKSILFSPGEKYSQYCLCKVVAGKDGTLYYKNDSGNIFAVRSSGTNAISRLVNSFIALILRLFRFG